MACLLLLVGIGGCEQIDEAKKVAGGLVAESVDEAKKAAAKIIDQSMADAKESIGIESSSPEESQVQSENKDAGSVEIEVGEDSKEN